MKKRIAIIGAGELGLQICNFFIECNKYHVIGFFDDTLAPDTLIFESIGVIGGISDIDDCFNQNRFDALVLAIGYRHMEFRDNIFSSYNSKIEFISFIHHTAIVDSSCVFGKGVIVYPGCILDKNCIINNNVILNLGVIVSHDTEIGENTFVAPGVVFSGFSRISSNSFIGSGSVISDNIYIVNNTVIGAGSVVVNNIDIPGTYVGNPAKRLT
jgi:sugar O-acyltransferase (sialic acid O-acetyltransferase NeuD family)